MISNNSVQHKSAAGANYSTEPRNGKDFGLTPRGSNSTSKNWDLIWEAATKLGFPKRKRGGSVASIHWAILRPYAASLGMNTHRKKRIEIVAWVEAAEKAIAQSQCTKTELDTAKSEVKATETDKLTELDKLENTVKSLAVTEPTIRVLFS